MRLRFLFQSAISSSGTVTNRQNELAGELRSHIDTARFFTTGLTQVEKRLAMPTKDILF
jgi:hypothetical protein